MKIPDNPGRVTGGAYFSPGRRVYRYALWRYWDVGPVLGYCGLNPSTADEVDDDPTVAGMIRRAKNWGFGGLIVVNAFAYRATDPQDLYRVTDPIGSKNDETIQGVAGRVTSLICGWGNHGQLRDRSSQMRNLLRAVADRLQIFGLNKTGEPTHPLYLKHDHPVTAWDVNC